jgi:MerR family transcriptional regulator, copper efflux regulator
MERPSLRAGQVAARAGVHRETLRYYERRRLIPPPPRRLSGYRAYPAETVERVRLIKWAQGLGFSLSEIGELARTRDHVHRRVRDMRARAGSKIHEIDEKIGRLRAMRRQLRAIIRCRCNGNCPIVARALSKGSQQ